MESKSSLVSNNQSSDCAKHTLCDSPGSTLRKRTLAILGFHKIGEPSPGAWETWYYITESTFISYLSYLHENGWQVIGLTTFLQGLKVPESLPQRAALITFDDGYRSVLDVALPCLLQFKYPAIHFVPTNFIGERNWFDQGAEPEEAICDWDDLRELEHWGVSVQPHGALHQRFSELNLAEQEEELYRSKAALETGLGKPVQVFSYPYGDDGMNSQALKQAMKQAGFQAACLYGGGPNPLPITDPYRLTRLAMGPDTDLQAALAEGLD